MMHNLVHLNCKQRCSISLTKNKTFQTSFLRCSFIFNFNFKFFFDNECKGIDNVFLHFHNSVDTPFKVFF